MIVIQTSEELNLKTFSYKRKVNAHLPSLTIRHKKPQNFQDSTSVMLIHLYLAAKQGLTIPNY